MYIRGLLVRANFNEGTLDDQGRKREGTWWLDIEGLSVMADQEQYPIEILAGNRVELEVLLRQGKSGRSYAKSLTPVRIYDESHNGKVK